MRILYVVVGGIQWRMLPKEYPKWQSVYSYFRNWRKDGIWQRIHDTLRAKVRRQAGRHKHATAGCVDSQSVKTTPLPGFVAMTVASRSRDANVSEGLLNFPPNGG